MATVSNAHGALGNWRLIEQADTYTYMYNAYCAARLLWMTLIERWHRYDAAHMDAQNSFDINSA